MKRKIQLIFWVCLCVPLLLKGEEHEVQRPNKPVVNEAFLRNIFQFAELYSHVIDEYKADLYIKGKLETHKRNRLIRYVPSMFRFEKGVKEYISESLSEIHYTAPDIYDRKMKAFNSTFPRNKGQITDLYDYINLNIYATTLSSGKLLSPLDKRNSKYYTYLLDSITGTSDSLCYKILIIPKFRSTQLVKGYMWVSDQIWSIRQIYFEGVYDVIRFKVGVEMGTYGDEEFLPKKFDLNLQFKFLGNNIEMKGNAWLKYKEIKLYNKPEQIRKSPNKHRHDLTRSYNFSADTAKLISDEKEFSSIRPFPLTTEEDSLYNSWYKRKDTITFKPFNIKKKTQELWGQVGDALISSYNVNLPGVGSVKCSPLINPVSLEYSHSRGLTYRQKFKYNRFLTHSEHLLRIVPQIGYSFKDKQLYVKTDAQYQYWPQKQGELEIHVGNGNRIYSSVVLDQLKQWPDSVFNLGNAQLDYFKDVYMNMFNSIEVVNGLTIKAGISMHWRYLVNNSRIELTTKVSNKEWAEIRGITSSYNSFAPRIQIQWTPSLYYYMNGKRKINTSSKFPTFMIDYERGIKGLFESNGAHERWEFDMQHNIRLGGIQSLGYRLSAGVFTKQEHMYFIDFENFRRHNIPEDWNDEIGGTFQLLSSRWYNSSRKYVRGHVTYESPFILLKPFNSWLGMIQQERLYMGILSMPKFRPYIEFGYGIGTHIFDAGVFVSNVNGKFESIGCKFTFELFRDD